MDNVLCDPCGHSGFLSCKREAEVADLRAKLAAAEKREAEAWAQFHELSERSGAAVDAATARAEKAERDYIALCEKSNADEAEAMRVCREFQQAAFDRDALASHNAALRAALEKIVGLNGSAAYLPPHEPTAGKAIGIARSALALTPPAAGKQEDTCEK